MNIEYQSNMELQKFQYYPMIQLFRKYVGEDFERDVRDLMNNELVISVSGGQNIKGLIVEGRLTGWYSILLEQMVRENVVRILLESDEPTKIKRIMKRHDISKNDSIAMLVRDQQDKCRWKNEFGISYDDHSIYHYIYENNDECSLESFMKNLEI